MASDLTGPQAGLNFYPIVTKTSATRARFTALNPTQLQPRCMHAPVEISIPILWWGCCQLSQGDRLTPQMPSQRQPVSFVCNLSHLFWTVTKMSRSAFWECSTSHVTILLAVLSSESYLYRRHLQWIFRNGIVSKYINIPSISTWSRCMVSV